MHRVRVVCKDCRFYSDEGFSQRCIQEDNLDTNWIGMVYKKHPMELNMRGRCEDYEKI